MTTVIVSSAVANKPLNGGNAWVILSWVLGLRNLGFRVFFVEQLSRASCIDRCGAPARFEDSLNLAYFRQVMGEFGLANSSALILDDGEQTEGLTQAELLDLADDADLLLNISGHLTLSSLMHRLRRKVYLDLDPGFTQFWHASGSHGPRLAGHDLYFTIGENIGTPDCPIPTADIPWRTTRQPVVLENWPVSRGGDHNRFTTVASWRGPYGPVEYDGVTYGLKVHQFRKFLELPGLVLDARFEIALDIHPADARDEQQLRQAGWALSDPSSTVPDPDGFRRYVQASGSEFSVAQGIYVDTASGWFSDRTVRYLASGKPALVQDTGFSRTYAAGEGLIPFRSLSEAVEGARQIRRDYDRHCDAARAVAETYFDSDKVLGRLIDDVGIAS